MMLLHREDNLEMNILIDDSFFQLMWVTNEGDLEYVVEYSSLQNLIKQKNAYQLMQISNSKDSISCLNIKLIY